MKLPSVAILSIVFLLFGAQVWGQPQPVTSTAGQVEIIDELKIDLMCVCGCPHQLGQCGDECGVAPQLIQDIETRLSAGASKANIFQVYEAQYGARVYAAPKPEGFNLVGWAMPFLALLMGGGLVWLAVKKLKPEGVRESPKRHDAASPVSDKYRKLIDKELDR